MSSEEYKLKQAEEFEQEKKYLHALQIYHALLSSDTHKRTACVKLCELYERMDKVDKAVGLAQRFLDDNPDDIDVRKYLGHFLLRNNEFDYSLDVLSSVSCEDNPEVYFLKGLAHYNLNESEIAIINFNNFVEKSKNSELIPEGHHYLAKCYIEDGKLDKALESINTALQFDSQRYDYELTLAVIFYYKEMFYHSYEAVRRAMKLNQNNPVVREWAGKVLYKMGELAKAEEHLKKAIELSDGNSSLYSLLGIICANNGKQEEAKGYFEMALKIDPYDELALSWHNKEFQSL